MQGFEPSEVLYSRQQDQSFKELFGDRFYTFRQEDWVFTEEFGRESLNKHFQTKNLKGFGVEDLTEGIIAAGSILQYISEAQHKELGHISKISRSEERRVGKECKSRW